MAKKKNIQVSVSQEESRQAQQVLEQYHQIADNLHESTDQKQAETALTEINNMPEGAQIALVKALSKEPHIEAADVLLAVNELSPVKSVRKEAKRSLIRLEEARIYPGWIPPVSRAAVVQVQVETGPMRFWKGIVTDTRDMGEVQLTLCFEQVDDPGTVRVLGFLLEFWRDGVKDFFSRIESKRSFENFAAQMETRLGDVKTKDCSLAAARRLILEALDVNKRYGTLPHRDYRLNVSLVNQLVLEAPDLEEDIDLDEDADFDEDEEEEEEEEEEDIDLHDLSPQEVVTTFVEYWIDGDYDTAYDLLSSDSPLREGLSRDEWIERRETWSDEALPGDLQPNFIHERGPQKSGLWLPNLFSASRSVTRKEIETGWSIELAETSLDDTLPELPKATAVYEETTRHWFWTTYVLVREDDAWRIQSMTDEGVNALALSIEELQKRNEENDKYLEQFARKHKLADIQNITDAQAQRYLEDIFWRLMQAIYYTDILIKKLPLDSAIYEEAAGRSIILGQHERSIVYLEALTQRFPEKRALYLRRTAAAQRELSRKYFDEGDKERGEHFQELAEEALRESLALEDRFETRISLAEVLIDRDERLDEAEDHLLQAKVQATELSDLEHIELHLGEIAMVQERYQEALSHFQYVAEHHPDDSDAWFDVAEAHKKLKNFEEAETSYKRAIELSPDDVDLYFTFSDMYAENNQPEKALTVIEDALNANPDSVTLSIFLSTTYFERGDYEKAEKYLEEAERIDPESQLVKMSRQVLNMSRATQLRSLPSGYKPIRQVPNIGKLNRPGKKKKRGR